MTINGFKIISCPFCLQQYKVTNYGSFNTFRANFYSDGYVTGGVPNFPEVVRCVNGNCNGFFLVKDQPILFDLDKDSSKGNEWDRTYSLAAYNINSNDLEDALDSVFCEYTENERMVRKLLHHRFNDKFRKDRNYVFPPNEKLTYIRNIEKLIYFAEDDPTPEGRLYVAELFREKGDFDIGIEILKNISSDTASVTDLKEKIFSQCKLKDPLVFNIGAVGVKKEFCCDRCGDQIILFDLSKMDSILGYNHYRCLMENRAFDSASKEKNPARCYTTTIWQRIFTSKKPYKSFIPKPSIECPTCGSTETIVFKPQDAKCLTCGKGKYRKITWFE